MRCNGEPEPFLNILLLPNKKLSNLSLTVSTINYPDLSIYNIPV